MTVLHNSIRIHAPPGRVWSALTSLESLSDYDPGIAASRLLSEAREGIGAARQCDMAAGGWFRERVTAWTPGQVLAFELYECTLPIKSLKHAYRLESDGKSTVVSQRMEYQLKFGPLGALMDALVVRRKWDAGIKGFFAGLKSHLERTSRTGLTDDAAEGPGRAAAL